MGIEWLRALSLFVTVLIISAVIAFHGRRGRHRKRFHGRPRAHVVALPVVAPLEVPVDEPSRGRRKPDWVRAEVLRLKALMGAVGVRKVAEMFNGLYGHRATVGRTFVTELLKAHRYQLACIARDLRSRPPKRYRVNSVWAMDFTFQADATGNVHSAIGLVDHGSRLLLRLKRLTNRSAWTVLGHLCLAIGKYGKPRAVRSDNEPVFRSKLLRFALKVFGIRQQFTLPHSPWQNGRIERLFGTLKPLLRRLALANANALDTALFEFRLFYNHVRTHQNLGGRTPAEVWAARSDRTPRLPLREAPKLVSALGGLLVGYYLRR
jgi:putative transposase